MDSDTEKNMTESETRRNVDCGTLKNVEGGKQATTSDRAVTVQQATATPTGRKRREQLSETLNSYKQQKLKKKLPADSQLVYFAEKELEVKQSMMDKLDKMSSDHKETMNVLTTNLKTLGDTISNAFSLLQQSLQPHPSGPTFRPQQALQTISNSGAFMPTAYEHPYYGPPDHHMFPQSSPPQPNINFQPIIPSRSEPNISPLGTSWASSRASTNSARVLSPIQCDDEDDD